VWAAIGGTNYRENVMSLLITFTLITKDCVRFVEFVSVIEI